MNLNGVRGQMGFHQLGPFDQAYTGIVKIFFQSEIDQLLRLTQPVKIKMIHRKASPLVFVDQGEGRTGDLGRDVQAGAHSAYARCFSAPHLAVKSDHASLRQFGGKSTAKIKGLLRAVADFLKGDRLRLGRILSGVRQRAPFI